MLSGKGFFPVHWKQYDLEEMGRNVRILEKTGSKQRVLSLVRWKALLLLLLLVLKAISVESY